MNKNKRLNEKWLKSAIIGAVWASSEIVLGSFLHNLRVPFSGSILTAIGLMILISSAYVWKDKGIFWRAGLICALMKTMSPSAVIFGPMIGIFTESVLLEISVRLLGRNYFGYIIGSILAVSWSLFQKIINFIIFYGFNIVELYKNLMKFVEKQLNLHYETLWIPIIILLLIYSLIGVFAAFFGIQTGIKLEKQPVPFNPQNFKSRKFNNQQKDNTAFNYSLIWFFLNLLLIAGALIAISLTNWRVWVISSVVVILVWVYRYKRALRQLSKPKFWIFFALITLLAAFIFTQIQSKSILDALLIGMEMNFRASVLVLGFSVIGTELYNPKIRLFFSKTFMKQLPLALELAVKSLPLIIANIPDFKTLIKNPVVVISQLIAYAEYRFSELKKELGFVPEILIIIGPINSGKTTFIRQMIESLKSYNITTGGICSMKIFEDNERIGYDLVNIKNNQKEIFLRRESNPDFEKIGIFSIYPASIIFGKEILKPENNTENSVVIIDEIGKLELTGKGWADSLTRLLKEGKKHLVIVVRNDFVEKVINKWELRNYSVYNVTENQNQSVIEQFIQKIELSSLSEYISRDSETRYS